MRIGLVSGTGFAGFPDATPLTIHTPFGDVEAAVASAGGVEWFVVHRHAPGHRLPPHRINHRANVDALARARCDRVLALNVVGALDPSIRAGVYAVPSDWLDLAPREGSTFFDDAPVHVDMTEPYCPEVRAALLDAARSRGLPLHDGGVMTTTRGPRFETPAEVAALRGLGAHLVSMTAMPETPLARERGLCYASLALVTNLATGLGPRVSTAEIVRLARAMQTEAVEVALAASRRLGGRACRCGRAHEAAAIQA